MASDFQIGSRLTKALAVAALNLPIPDLGGDLFSDTALHPTAGTALPSPGGWACVDILADTVFDAATLCNIAGVAGGPTIPKGTLLRGVFTAIKLTSGTVIAYRGAKKTS